jgi:hypothetical protein
VGGTLDVMITWMDALGNETASTLMGTYTTTIPTNDRTSTLRVTPPAPPHGAVNLVVYLNLTIAGIQDVDRADNPTYQRIVLPGLPSPFIVTSYTKNPVSAKGAGLPPGWGLINHYGEGSSSCGIYLESFSGLHLRDLEIKNFPCDGVCLNSGMMSDVSALRTNFHHNGRSGFAGNLGNNIHLDACMFNHNDSCGIDFEMSMHGHALRRLKVYRSSFTNSGFGIALSAYSGDALVEDCLVEDCIFDNNMHHTRVVTELTTNGSGVDVSDSRAATVVLPSWFGISDYPVSVKFLSTSSFIPGNVTITNETSTNFTVNWDNVAPAGTTLTWTINGTANNVRFRDCTFGYAINAYGCVVSASGYGFFDGCTFDGVSRPPAYNPTNYNAKVNPAIPLVFQAPALSG